MATKKIPVTILTGFLGSGKTTLLNHILESPHHGMKFAIIENEFGEVGVDDKVIKEDSEEQVIEVMNGCICCTVRGDLVKVLKRLKDRVSDFNAVIIETTGLADPAPVAQTFCVDDDIEAFYYLDGIITVVDARHWLQHLREEKPDGVENEAAEQVAFADRVLLNKIDLVNESELKEVESEIKSMNCSAQIFHTQQSNVDPTKLLNIKAFSLKRVLEMDPEFMNTDGEHQHDTTVSSVSFRFEGEVNVNRMEQLIDAMLKTKATDMFRYKGVLAVKGMSNKYVFQGVHMLFNGKFSADLAWKEDEIRECRMVFIGRNLDKSMLEQLWHSCKVVDDLRFKVGDEVEAMTDSGWSLGKVTKLWDNGDPFSVLLTNGNVVVAPDDIDACIRPAKKAKVSA